MDSSVVLLTQLEPGFYLYRWEVLIYHTIVGVDNVDFEERHRSQAAITILQPSIRVYESLTEK